MILKNLHNTYKYLNSNYIPDAFGGLSPIESIFGRALSFFEILF